MRPPAVVTKAMTVVISQTESVAVGKARLPSLCLASKLCYSV
jgi:hypothetical protein